MRRDDDGEPQLKPGVDPIEAAMRLWPGPENFAKREAIGHLVGLDRALHSVMELRADADDLIFPEISRLWIQPTRTEILLALLVAELQAAVRHAGEALDMLAAARAENDIHNCAERLLERQERREESECG